MTVCSSASRFALSSRRFLAPAFAMRNLLLVCDLRCASLPALSQDKAPLYRAFASSNLIKQSLLAASPWLDRRSLQDSVLMLIVRQHKGALCCWPVDQPAVPGTAGHFWSMQAIDGDSAKMQAKASHTYQCRTIFYLGQHGQMWLLSGRK